MQEAETEASGTVEGTTIVATSIAQDDQIANTTATQQTRRVAHRHHHRPGHGALHQHYRHHHHHRCCGRQDSHSCPDQTGNDENSQRPREAQPGSAPHSATFGSFAQNQGGSNRSGGGGVGVDVGADGMTDIEEENGADAFIHNPPHTAPLRMMSDPEQHSRPLPTSPQQQRQILKTSSSRNLLVTEGRITPAPSYRSPSLDHQRDSISTHSSELSSVSSDRSSKRSGVILRRPRSYGSLDGSDQLSEPVPKRSATLESHSSTSTFGVGQQVYDGDAILNSIDAANVSRQKTNKVHFKTSRSTTMESTNSHGGPNQLRVPPQSSGQKYDRPTRSPYRLSAQSAAQSRASENTRASWLSYENELQSRDRRISAMVDDVLPGLTQKDEIGQQALRKRTKSDKHRSGFVESMLGFDKMTPADLIYGEGSKIDGGFGFAIPSMARESTILLDSRNDRYRTSGSTERTSTHNRTQKQRKGTSDSSSSRFSADTASIISSISGYVMHGRNAAQRESGDGKRNQRDRSSRQSTSSFTSSLASFIRPSSLSDRVNEKDIRPSKLDLNKNGARGGGGGGNKGVTKNARFRAPSESDRGSSNSQMPNSAQWEDVQLDSHGKNERLAAAVGAKLPPKRHYSRDESTTSELTVIEEESSEKDEIVRERETNNRETTSSGYDSEKNYHNTYLSGLTSTDDARTTMNLPPGLSQADIVAICLVQGMVPPGLPPDDTLVTWSGPMSPSNPRNFSAATKWYACILVSWSTFLANAATNMIAPALGLMSVTYKELYTMWIRGSLIGSYIFAFTFAPLIFGPMSEIMGRKPVLILGTVVFFVACLLSGFVTAVWQLMILRFLSALGASAPMSIGGAVLTDMYAPDERGRAMTLFALAPQLAPSLGPIVGGWITQEAKSWRWIFFTAAICGFTAAAPMFFVKETYTPSILAKRAKKLRKETGNNQLTTIFERRQESTKQIITRGVVRPLVLFSCEPIVQLLTLYVSLIYGIIHLMVATFPAVFGTIYAEYPGWASMHFINITIGTIVGGFLGGYLVEKHYHNPSLNNRGIAKPEFKFYCMLYTVWIPPVGLMIYGLITYFGIHWIFADIGIVVFCIGISIAVVAIQSYMVDCYSLLAGSALTATIVFRSIVGTGATIGSEDLLLHAGMLWSNVALSAACIFIGVPAAYYVYFWGPSMRQKSRHATHKR